MRFIINSHLAESKNRYGMVEPVSNQIIKK
jgi:hypothetical protein